MRDVCEWLVMRVGTQISCLRLLSSVICCGLSVSVVCRSTLTLLESPINTTSFRSETALSSIGSRLSSTDEVALGGLYIFPSKSVLVHYI